MPRPCFDRGPPTAPRHAIGQQALTKDRRRAVVVRGPAMQQAGTINSENGAGSKSRMRANPIVMMAPALAGIWPRAGVQDFDIELFVGQPRANVSPASVDAITFFASDHNSANIQPRSSGNERDSPEQVVPVN